MFRPRPPRAQSHRGSLVWDHMTFKDEKTVMCTHCPAQYRYHKDGCTSPMIKHLKDRHAELLDQGAPDASSAGEKGTTQQNQTLRSPGNSECKPRFRRSYSKEVLQICWNNMTRTENGKVECNICKKQYIFYHERAVSCLVSHLNKCHPEVFPSAVPAPIIEVNNTNDNVKRPEAEDVVTEEAQGVSSAKKMCVDDSVQNVQVVQHLETSSATEEKVSKEKGRQKSDASRKQLVDGAILDFVVTDNEPLSIVQQRGFKNLVKVLDPKYHLLSLKELEETLLPERYNMEKRSIIEELNLTKSVSISIDCWVSFTNRAFFTISAHYISEDWQLKTKCLATKADGSSHSVETLASFFEDTFKEFDIEEKVTTIVTDNVIDISDVVEAIDAKYQACFAHQLNQVIQESIEGVEPMKSILKNVRDIVAYFNSSIMATKNLTALHERRGNSAPKLKEESFPGWNSTYEMLQSYVCQQDEVNIVLSLSGRQASCVQASNRQSLKAAMDTLHPFYEATQELCKHNYSQASKIIPIVKILKKLTGRKDSSLSKTLHENLCRRFSDVEQKPHLQMATLLDPRFKRSAFSSQYLANTAVERLVEEANKRIVKSDNSEVQCSAASTNENSVLWSEFDEELANSEDVESEESTEIDIEVQSYLKKAALPRNKSPFQWWKENACVLPQLESIAKDFLAIPATTIPSDRLFSSEGQSVAFRRSKLDKNNVDKVLFLYSNSCDYSTSIDSV